MNTEQWKQYYIGMVKRGIRPEKFPEMIARCGGAIEKTEVDKAGKELVRLETFEETKDRLTAEIKAISFMVGEQYAG